MRVGGEEDVIGVDDDGVGGLPCGSDWDSRVAMDAR